MKSASIMMIQNFMLKITHSDPSHHTSLHNTETSHHRKKYLIFKICLCKFHDLLTDRV